MKCVTTFHSHIITSAIFLPAAVGPRGSETEPMRAGPSMRCGQKIVEVLKGTLSIKWVSSLVTCWVLQGEEITCSVLSWSAPQKNLKLMLFDVKLFQ
jgi:hypothetical protein